MMLVLTKEQRVYLKEIKLRMIDSESSYEANINFIDSLLRLGTYTEINKKVLNNYSNYFQV